MHAARIWTPLALAALTTCVLAQGVKPGPKRRADEGKGPFKSLLIQGGIVIDGTGGPPRGPVDIWVENNRIVSIGRRRALSKADHVVDARGKYVLPGFIDMHAHCGGSRKAPEAEYVYKLWMAHGVTTVRGVPLSGLSWSLREKQRSARNEIVAPRIFVYQRPGAVDTPQQAREIVRRFARRGVDGLKLGSYRPEIMKALIDTAHENGMGTVAHLAQTGVAQMNAIDAARLGLDTVTHFYGHFEALMKDYVVQPWPVDHNYNNEQHRFAQVARLWDKTHEPGSDEWNAYLREHLKLGTVWDPTMTIYSAGRDVMRARTAEWHDEYTLPSLMDFFTPSPKSHGSYWFYWTTHDEVAWRNFYHRWMRLINDYKKLGGRITCGADSGFIYDTYGFGYVDELELLQEAGFHPLEALQCATYNGAKTIFEAKGKPIEFGVLRKGLLADMIVVNENPLENFKVLYATGWPKRNAKTGEMERTKGILWTIKDGIVYDAKQMLRDVRAMVDAQKEKRAQRKKAKADTENAAARVQREKKPRFKGVELYSWKDDAGSWMFSLMDGTNRRKPINEWKNSKTRVRGVDALCNELRKLAKGEHVMWATHFPGCETPPAKIRDVVKDTAREAGLNLN